ncbi:MAG: carbohydrate kinase [Roseiflexaceae bacterium]
MAPLITSMGEILIDFLPMNEAGHTVGFRMFPGGSPLNVAVASARLGQPTAFAGMVARDFFGRYLRQYATSQQIDTRFLLDSDASSTLAFVAIEDNEPSFSFYGEGAADTLLTPALLPDAFYAETRALHVGSISLLRGTTPQAVLAAVEGLRSKALIQFDPNIRPGLIHDAAAYRALIDHLAGMVDIFKISAADLEWLMPGLSLEEAAQRIAAFGPALVIVTQGGKGGLALRDGQRLRIPAFAITLADTVGAGDTFNGGFLVALAEREALSRQALAELAPDQLSAALRMASAAAALNCTRAGCDPPTRAELRAFADL